MKATCPICLKPVTVRDGKLLHHVWSAGGGWLRVCAGSDTTPKPATNSSR